MCATSELFVIYSYFLREGVTQLQSHTKTKRLQGKQYLCFKVKYDVYCHVLIIKINIILIVSKDVQYFCVPPFHLITTSSFRRIHEIIFCLNVISIFSQTLFQCVLQLKGRFTFTRSEKKTRQAIQSCYYTGNSIVKCSMAITTLFDNNIVVQKYLK